MMKRRLRKPLAILLTLMMVVGVFPARALAESPSSVIKVYVTISVEGNIPKGSENTFMAQVPVTVTDANGNGDLDIDDALYILHALHCPDGYSSAVDPQYNSLGITKLWKDLSGNYGYRVNDYMASSLDDPVKDGDHIVASVGDWKHPYTRFDSFEKTAVVGQDIYLKLEKDVWPEGWTALSGAKIYNIEDKEAALGTTNSSGEETISFDELGTYYITALNSDTTIVPPVCQVKVVESKEAPEVTDTTLSALTLMFPGVISSDGSPYLGSSGMSVGNTVSTISVDANAKNASARISTVYKKADKEIFSPYVLGNNVDLAVGDNTFKLTVTNRVYPENTHENILIIKRAKAETGKSEIGDDVNTVINGVKEIGDRIPTTDWILAMGAAGITPSPAQKNLYLKYVLNEINKFNKVNTTIPPKTMAQIAIALTSLGIDAREIPNLDGGEAINLVNKVAAAYDVSKDSNPVVWSASYVLSLYDLGNYEVPREAASTREQLIDAIIGTEKDWDIWGADGVGLALCALAPYYDTNAEVKAAVDRAVISLSARQKMDGGILSNWGPSSNTVSMIIAGLNAIGIDANTDVSFIKGGRSLLMNLLSFRTLDNKLGYDNNTTSSPAAGDQGFQALATWQNLTNTRSSNLYHFDKEIAPYTNWPDAKLLTSIAVINLPTKVTYDLGAADTVVDTRGIAVTATYNADTTEKVQDYTVSSIDCSTAGTKTVTVTYQGKTATFMVTVRDVKGNEPQKDIASVTVQNGSNVVARNSAIVIEAGATTAMDVLKMTLDAAGKTYVIRGGSYVSAIDGKSEFGEGPNSGWLYKVNGLTPSTTAAGDYVLKNGDSVLWYYTQDYTKDSSSSNWTPPAKEENILKPNVTVKEGLAAAYVSEADVSAAISAAKDKGGKSIVINPEIKGTAKKVTVNIPKKSLSNIATQTKAHLEIKTPIGTVTIPNPALASIVSMAKGSDVMVSLDTVEKAFLTAEQKNAVGDNQVYDISILSDGEHIKSFGDNSITIALPYTLKAKENSANVKVWYLSDAGELEQMACIYDKAIGLASFTSKHLSYYAVGYAVSWTNPFVDVKSSDWFYGAVEHALQNSLMNGTSTETFAPHGHMTRAMLVTVLHRMEDKPSVTGINGFADVQDKQWYTDAILWAHTNGIVTGYDENLFGTNDSVTREQLATILYRYAQYKGYDVTKKTTLTAYTDALSISDYAQSAMAWANAEGLIQGTTITRLAPVATASRAQVATIFKRFAEDITK